MEPFHLLSVPQGCSLPLCAALLRKPYNANAFHLSPSCSQSGGYNKLTNYGISACIQVSLPSPAYPLFFRWIYLTALPTHIVAVFYYFLSFAVNDAHEVPLAYASSTGFAYLTRSVYLSPHFRRTDFVPITTLERQS